MRGKKPAAKKAPKEKKAQKVAEEKAGLPAVVEARPEEKKEIAAYATEKLTEQRILEGFDLMGITSKLQDKEKSLFLAISKLHNLDPLKREIHAVKIWDSDAGDSKLTPVTGYEVYLDRAEQTGRLHYWNINTTGEVNEKEPRKSTLQATITIKRKDWPKEFTWTARYKECVRLKRDGGPSATWRERPEFMTEKCAIGQGFRLCFRECLRGMPYLAEEVGMTDEEINEKEDEHPALEEPRAVTPDAEASLLAAGEKLDAALEKPTMADERKAQESEEDETLKTVKLEAQELMTYIVSVNKRLARPYTKAETDAMKAAAVAAANAKDLQKLQNIITDWQIDIDARKNG